jgi:hypothetical protein
MAGPDPTQEQDDSGDQESSMTPDIEQVLWELLVAGGEPGEESDDTRG